MLNQFSRYEEEFQNWVKGGYPGVRPETLDYLHHLSDPRDETEPREGTLWPHQWDSLLRVVFSHEIRRGDLAQPDGLLLNVVTGGGKTAVIAAVMAWLRTAHDIQRFVILCPNLIVRDRLEADFADGRVFADRDLIPPDSVIDRDDFALTTLGSDRPGGWANLLGSTVILGNIHQFYASSKTGQANLAHLRNGGRFALFNDEAHNSPAPEWDNTLQTLREHIILRVDTTATPDRADGGQPDSKMIYEYLIQDALADRLVKTPVVYQPNIATVELTYTDRNTGETRRVEEIDWEEVERKGISPAQWVTDDKPMRQQMQIALRRLKEQERRAKGRYQPILFVVAVSKLDAQHAAKTLNNYFKINALLITEESSDAERRQAADLQNARRAGKPYKAVVSVLMLREGWDVPEVGVILLLRKFSSKVYGQQVIGRGLRRVRNHGVAEDEPQICAVVDHPKLEHQWLWKIFDSAIRDNVGLDDEFEETEDLPTVRMRQELVNPQNIIVVPFPDFEDDEDITVDINTPIAEPLRNWREVLDRLEYPAQTITITDQEITGVYERQLDSEGWRTVKTAPDPEQTGPVTDALDALDALDDLEDEDLAEAVKNELLEMAERLLLHAGHTAQFTGQIYRILLGHVRSQFLDGASLGLAKRHRLEAARRMIPLVEKQLTEKAGLVEGMVKYGDQ